MPGEAWASRIARVRGFGYAVSDARRYANWAIWARRVWVME
jgi:hypothetical protein